MECLYAHQEFGAAHSLLLSGMQQCNSSKDLLLQARILASSNEYVLALYFLNLIEDSAYEEIVRNEYIRIGELKGLDFTQYSGYIAFNKKSTAYDDLPFLSDSAHLEVLKEVVYDKQLFPRKIQTHGRVLPLDQELSPDWMKYIERQDYLDIGPAELVGDSIIFITVLNPTAFGFKHPAQYEIVAINIQKKKTVARYKLSEQGAFMHPAVKGDTLYFASNMAGGFGGMDIWKVEIQAEGFSAPINLGPIVNTAANEIFPECTDTHVYYSSDRVDRGYGGLDIYKVSENDDRSELLPYPLNSAYDDFAYFRCTQDTSGIFSNRPGGNGGDDVYFVIETSPKLFFNEIVGRIEANGVNLSGTTIEVNKADGSFVGHTTLDAAGYFKLKHVKGDEEYQLQVLDQELPEGSRLKLYDQKGGIVKEVELHSTGVFKFELLTPEDYYIYRMENEDESVLSIDIEGFVSIDEELEEGLRIYLEDSNGQLIGVSTTSETGSFEFDAMKPDSRYVIRSEVNNPDAIIRILDNEGNVIQTINPSEENSYVYVRLKDTDQVITITNEMNQEVKVSEREQFNVPVIHFELDRSALSIESEVSLNRVSNLLKKNPSINIEISGHTDSRGEEAYNLELSQKRIDAVIAYLSETGIDSSRLIGKGYGETLIKNKCVDGVECSEEEHAVNRRTEMRVYKNPHL